MRERNNQNLNKSKQENDELKKHSVKQQKDNSRAVKGRKNIVSDDERPITGWDSFI